MKYIRCFISLSFNQLLFLLSGFQSTFCWICEFVRTCLFPFSLVSCQIYRFYLTSVPSSSGLLCCSFLLISDSCPTLHFVSNLMERNHLHSNKLYSDVCRRSVRRFHDFISLATTIYWRFLVSRQIPLSFRHISKSCLLEFTALSLTLDRRQLSRWNLSMVKSFH